MSLDRFVAARVAATNFLLRLQSKDGAWRDFQLKPGRADGWTTAYIGHRLVPLARTIPDVADAVAAATGFLEHTRAPHGGWAYNRNSPVDADSTASAILFLRDVKAEVLAKDDAMLARFQRDDGGFSTFRFASPDHGWCRAHVEVTATALRALGQRLSPDHVRIRTGIAWLRQKLREKESAYWWPGDRYLRLEIARLRKCCGALEPLQRSDPSASAEHAFHTALDLEADILERAPEAARSDLATALVRSQRADGSWTAQPMLRVVDPTDRTNAAGPLVSDDRRALTTATVLAALNAFTFALEQAEAVKVRGELSATWDPAGGRNGPARVDYRRAPFWSDLASCHQICTEPVRSASRVRRTAVDD
jgi:hypothetical protein